MGNAMAFLNDKPNRDKYRKGSHHKECKEKIDEFLKHNEITQEPDAGFIHVGLKSGGKINDRNTYISNLKGVNARRFKNRKEIHCKYCDELFKPIKYSRPPTSKELSEGNSGYEQYCLWCRNVPNPERKLIKKLGKKMFIYHKENDSNVTRFTSMYSLRKLLPIQEAKHALERNTSAIDERVGEIIMKAYRLNERYQKNHDIDNII